MRKSLLFITLMLSAGVSFAAGGNAPSGAGSTGVAQSLRGSAPTLQSGSQRVVPLQAGAQANGRALGEHVSGMAPLHPQTHGVFFGECVSELAITGAYHCSHHVDAD